MSHLLSENKFISVGLAADADRYDGDLDTPFFNTALYGIITFIMMHGAGGTGTVGVRIEEARNAAGLDLAQIDFRFRTGSEDGEGLSKLKNATAAGGFGLGPAANQLAIIEVLETELSEGFPFVRLELNEGVNSPVAAAVMVICGAAAYAQKVMPDATV